LITDDEEEEEKHVSSSEFSPKKDITKKFISIDS